MNERANEYPGPVDVRALWPVYSAVARRGVFVGTGADGVMALYAVEQGRSGAPRSVYICRWVTWLTH